MHLARVLILASAALVFPLTSMAQPAAPPAPITTPDADPMSDKALELFNEGKKHFREGKYGLAEAAFEAAWAIALKSKGIAANLGECEIRLGKFREAAEHLAISLRLAPPSDPQRARTAESFATVKGKIGTLVVTTKPTGAEILVNGTKIGESPLLDPIFVDPGKVKLRVRMEGYTSWEKELDVSAGQELPLEVSLETPTLPTSSVTSSTTSPTPTPRNMLPAYVGGGLGVVSMLVGGALLGTGFAQIADVDARMPRNEDGKPLCVRSADAGPELHPDCPALRNQAITAGTLVNTGVPMLVAGGIVTAGAALYFFWPSRIATPTKPAMRVLPIASTNGAGLVWIGAF